MFGVLVEELIDGEKAKVMKIFEEFKEARIYADNAACKGQNAVIFDWDSESGSYIEFYSV